MVLLSKNTYILQSSIQRIYILKKNKMIKTGIGAKFRFFTLETKSSELENYWIILPDREDNNKLKLLAWKYVYHLWLKSNYKSNAICCNKIKKQQKLNERPIKFHNQMTHKIVKSPPT